MVTDATFWSTATTRESGLVVFNSVVEDIEIRPRPKSRVDATDFFTELARIAAQRVKVVEFSFCKNALPRIHVLRGVGLLRLFASATYRTAKLGAPIRSTNPWTFLVRGHLAARYGLQLVYVPAPRHTTRTAKTATKGFQWA